MRVLGLLSVQTKPFYFLEVTKYLQRTCTRSTSAAKLIITYYLHRSCKWSTGGEDARLAMSLSFSLFLVDLVLVRRAAGLAAPETSAVWAPRMARGRGPSLPLTDRFPLPSARAQQGHLLGLWEVPVGSHPGCLRKGEPLPPWRKVLSGAVLDSAVVLRRRESRTGHHGGVSQRQGFSCRPHKRFLLCGSTRPPASPAGGAD